MELKLVDKNFTWVFILGLLFVIGRANAEIPDDFLQEFMSEAKRADIEFAGFSPDRGKVFFSSEHGGDWSCTTCHTDNPLVSGEHVITGKTISPLAPAANAERFSSTRQVTKWYRRNCNDVLNRECTSLEKGDVLAYLLSLQP